MAVRMRGRLWRLAVPQCHAWTAGDRFQAAFETSPDCVRIAGLPEGRYRVECFGARRGTKDPPAFSVSGPQTVADLYVEMPRKRPVRLEVFDEHGRPVEAGEVEMVGHGFRRTPEVPSWARMPESRDAPGSTFPLPGRTDAASGPWHPFRAVLASSGSFKLGVLMESSREEDSSYSYVFRAPDSSSVRFRVDSDSADETTFAAPCVPLEVLAANVFLPDGTPAVKAGATVEALCRAVAVPAGGEADTWKSVSIRVRVDLDGYRGAGCRWSYDWKDVRTRPRRVVMEPQ